MDIKRKYFNDALSNMDCECLKDVENAISTCNPTLDRNCVTKIRKVLLDNIYSSGWNKHPGVSFDSRITITAYKNNVGLCLQTGNISRIYADLLKLQHLWTIKNIQVGIIIVPVKSNALIMGSNMANYERLVNELKIFDRVITMPLCVIGFDALED